LSFSPFWLSDLKFFVREIEMTPGFFPQRSGKNFGACFLKISRFKIRQPPGNIFRPTDFHIDAPETIMPYGFSYWRAFKEKRPADFFSNAPEKILAQFFFR